MSPDAQKAKLSAAPAGSCESSLQTALSGAVKFVPTISVRVETNGDTTFKIEGLVRASVDALVKAQGGCAFNSERRFPKSPLKKVFCAAKFCIVLMLQMVAELEMKGTLTGTMQVMTSVDFKVAGEVTVNPSGHAEVNMKNPYGFSLAASAAASLRVGAGPVLTVWPIPGVPITTPCSTPRPEPRATWSTSRGCSSSRTLKRLHQ